MRLVLPLPPSANRMYRAVRGRGVILSAEGRQYKEVCALAAVAQIGTDPMEGNLVLHADFHMSRGDLDNRLKALGDALQGSAYFNDSQIVEIHAKRHHTKAMHRVEVTITEAA